MSTESNSDTQNKTPSNRMTDIDNDLMILKKKKVTKRYSDSDSDQSYDQKNKQKTKRRLTYDSDSDRSCNQKNKCKVISFLEYDDDFNSKKDNEDKKPNYKQNIIKIYNKTICKRDDGSNESDFSSSEYSSNDSKKSNSDDDFSTDTSDE